MSLNVRGISNFKKRRTIFTWDHAAISLILGEIGEAKGPGMWKMNVSLLVERYFNRVLTPECPLLNYLLLIGKINLWGCRRNNELPNIGGYKFKVSLKYDTEKFICTKNNTLDISCLLLSY